MPSRPQGLLCLARSSDGLETCSRHLETRADGKRLASGTPRWGLKSHEIVCEQHGILRFGPCGVRFADPYTATGLSESLNLLDFRGTGLER